MSNATSMTQEAFSAFLKEHGNCIEVVFRDQKKKFEEFTKIRLTDPTDNQTKELTEKAQTILSKKHKINKKNLDILNSVTHLERLNLVLNGLNLCASVAGFAIMFAKLNQMGDELGKKVDAVHRNMKGIHDVNIRFEYKKVLAEHTNMLDSERRQQPYSEEQLRQLVDAEYNVLDLLIETCKIDVSNDQENLIFSIFSLLAMLTVSLCKYDEMYYYNNHQIVGDQNPWHMSHDKWMTVYEVLSRDWFIEKLQDYGTFEAKLNTVQVDAYYLELMEQVSDLRAEVEDNQALIIALKDIDTFREYQRLSRQEVVNTVEAAFKEAGKDMDEAAVTSAFQHVMQQATLA